MDFVHCVASEFLCKLHRLKLQEAQVVMDITGLLFSSGVSTGILGCYSFIGGGKWNRDFSFCKISGKD